MAAPIDFLRNMHLNDAFKPPWQVPQQAPNVYVPQGNTQFDPFLGSGWDRALDALGAKAPGGIKVNPGTLGLQQLQAYEPYDTWANKTKSRIYGSTDPQIGPPTQG